MAREDPLAAHSASPAELKERLEAERAGAPFLVLRDGDGRQELVALDGERLSIGRAESNDVALGWDTEVSRLHAELERIGGEWTVSDDGLSRNGTYVNGQRISGRVRLRDGDVVRVGRTAMAFRRPDDQATQSQTRIAAAGPLQVELSAMQRQVLVALARPFKHADVATPATNQEIADEVHLSVDAVKSHLRVLFQRFGIEHLAQNAKRGALVAEALRAGVVTRREL